MGGRGGFIRRQETAISLRQHRRASCSAGAAAQVHEVSTFGGPGGALCVAVGDLPKMAAQAMEELQKSRKSFPASQGQVILRRRLNALTQNGLR